VRRGTWEDEEAETEAPPQGVEVGARRRVTAEEERVPLPGLSFKHPADRDCPS